MPRPRALLVVLSLLALLAALWGPAGGGATHAMEAVAAGAVAAEPCPGTSTSQRCEVKALPARCGAAPAPSVEPGTPVAGADGASRGVWPEVEPDPPRA